MAVCQCDIQDVCGPLRIHCRASLWRAYCHCEEWGTNNPNGWRREDIIQNIQLPKRPAVPLWAQWKLLTPDRVSNCITWAGSRRPCEGKTGQTTRASDIKPDSSRRQITRVLKWAYREVLVTKTFRLFSLHKCGRFHHPHSFSFFLIWRTFISD